jgi:DNA-binding winged helix-turn-helix (wHTH) protein
VNLEPGAFVHTSMHTHELSQGRTFDARTGEVTVAGRVARLEPQPAAVLALLLSRPGELVSHDEIRQQVWADGRHVEFAASLHYAVRQIRRALSDTEPWPGIETMPRRGYRLRGDALTQRTSATPRGGTEAATPKIPRRMPTTRRRFAWAALAVLALALVALIERAPNQHHAVAVSVARAVHDAVF